MLTYNRLLLCDQSGSRRRRQQSRPRRIGAPGLPRPYRSRAIGPRKVTVCRRIAVTTTTNGRYWSNECAKFRFAEPIDPAHSAT